MAGSKKASSKKDSTASVTKEEVSKEEKPENLIKISRGKSVGFYAKAAEHFLRGVGDKKAFEEIMISAVGNAIPTAASVADILARKEIGETKKIETCYAEVDTGRFRPQIKIQVKCLPFEKVSDEAPAPPTAERLKDPKMEKALKKVMKAGGKRGVEIEGAADMGGLQYFCTNMTEPNGDMDMLIECVKAMNEKSDPAEEERKGGSGAIGKLIVSMADNESEISLVAYVAPAKVKAGETTAKKWLTDVAKNLGCGAEVMAGSSDYYAMCNIKKDLDSGKVPVKLRDVAITHGLNYLRKHDLFPADDDDDDDEMVFGDEDFPQA